MAHKIPEIEWGLTLIKSLSFKDKLLFWANTFLEKPYISQPLGEGEDAPRFRFDGFDCMTYVETCLALAMSEWSGEILKNLDRIRYRDGKVGFHERCHFVSADWLPNNRSFLKLKDDICDKTVTRIIDRKRFFEEKANPLPANSSLKEREEVSLRYVSKEKIKDLSPLEINGTLALFIGNEDWIIVSHMGFIFEENEKAFLYHASSKTMRVMKQLLMEYIENRNSIIGVSFISILEKV